MNDASASILVIRRDNIGDLVCTTPLLRALRATYPEARLEVLANSYNSAVLHGNSDISELHVYRKLKHLGDGASALSALGKRIGMLWTLRRRKIGLVIVAAGPQDVRALNLARLIAPRRLICSDAIVAGQHEVERTFSAARALGIQGPIPPVLVVPDAASVAHFCASAHQAGLNPADRMIGVHVSARRKSQRWSAKRFAKLCSALYEELGAATILFWSPGGADHPQHPGDDAKAAEIQEMVGSKVPLFPWKTSHLPDLIGGISACDAVICSDGGAMHVAAGLGKPIVCFFGDSDVDRWRPWGVRHELLRAPTHDVEDITVDSAYSAAAKLLSD